MSDTPRVFANDFLSQWRAIRDDAHTALQRVGESGWLILGSEVQAFEKLLASSFGANFAVGTGNGLDALEIALRAAGIKRGDRVLTTPLSAFATTLAIIRAGGVPVFVDVDDSGLIDLSRVEDALSRGDIRFLMPVHLYGHAVDLERVDRIRKKHDIIVVEDCAQSVLASSHGVATGSTGLAATSFYPTKNMGGLGDGGAVLTNDEELAKRAKALRDYGQSDKYVHHYLGMNSRLDELQAAFLRSAILPRLEGWTRRRREIAAQYRAGLHSSRILVPPLPNGSASVWHLFPVLAVTDRDGLLTHLKDHGIVGGIHYPQLISDQEGIRSVPFEVNGPLGNAARFAGCEVSLPIHPFLSDADIGHVLTTCNSW